MYILLERKKEEKNPKIVVCDFVMRIFILFLKILKKSYYLSNVLVMMVTP